MSSDKAPAQFPGQPGAGVLTAVILALDLPVTGAAETTKGEYVACVTVQLFDRQKRAPAPKTERGFAQILKAGCGVLEHGLPISVLERDTRGRAKIRLYRDDGAIVLWTDVKEIGHGQE